MELEDLSIVEKAAMLSGGSEWDSRGNDRADIPGFVMSDGPHGVRRQLGEGDHLGIGDIALDEAQTRIIQRQIAALAHGQIVQHAHPVTGGQQGVNQVRADKAGTAGYENFSHDDNNDPAGSADRSARRAA